MAKRRAAEREEQFVMQHLTGCLQGERKRVVWKRVKRIKIRMLRWLSNVGRMSGCAVTSLSVGNAGVGH